MKSRKQTEIDSPRTRKNVDNSGLKGLEGAENQISGRIILISNEKKDRIYRKPSLRKLTADEAETIKGGIGGTGFGSSGKSATTKGDDESFVVTVTPQN